MSRTSNLNCLITTASSGILICTPQDRCTQTPRLQIVKISSQQLQVREFGVQVSAPVGQSFPDITPLLQEEAVAVVSTAPAVANDVVLTTQLQQGEVRQDPNQPKPDSKLAEQQSVKAQSTTQIPEQYILFLDVNDGGRQIDCIEYKLDKQNAFLKLTFVQYMSVCDKNLGSFRDLALKAKGRFIIKGPKTEVQWYTRVRTNQDQWPNMVIYPIEACSAGQYRMFTRFQDGVLLDVNMAFKHHKVQGQVVGGDIAALLNRTSYLLPVTESAASSPQANVKFLRVVQNGRNYMPRQYKPLPTRTFSPSRMKQRNWQKHSLKKIKRRPREFGKLIHKFDKSKSTTTKCRKCHYQPKIRQWHKLLSRLKEEVDVASIMSLYPRYTCKKCLAAAPVPTVLSFNDI